MRMKGRDGISRAIYFTATGRRVIVCSRFREENAGDARAGDQVGSETRTGDTRISKVRDLHKKWMKDRETYETISPNRPGGF
jgi:hypothetical protein